VLRLAGIGFGIGAYALFRAARLTTLVSAVGALTVIFQPGVLVLNGRILSDVLFAAVSTALLARWLRTPFPEPGVGAAVINGALVGVAILIRTSGVGLLPGLLAACGFGRQRLIACVVAMLLSAAGWWIAAEVRDDAPQPPRGSGSYLAELRAGYAEPGAWYRNPLTRLAETLVVSGNLLVPTNVSRLLARDTQWVFTPISWALGAVVLLTMYLGVRSRARSIDRRWIVVLAAAAGTMGVYLVWHVPFDYRFALPLTPLAILSFGWGVQWMARHWFRGGDRSAVRVMLVVWVLLATKGLALMGFVVCRYAYVDGAWVTPADKTYLAALDVVGKSVERDAVIAAMAPEALHYRTGRMAFPIIEDDDMSGRYGDWSRVRAWIDRVEPGRPIYFFAVRLGLPSIEARQLEALHRGREAEFEAMFVPGPYELFRWRGPAKAPGGDGR
jgi:hypothetical protein